MENAELLLIQSHRSLEKRIETLQLDYYYAEDQERTEITEKIKSLQLNKEEVEKRLKEVEYIIETLKKRDNILSVIRQVIRLLDMGRSLSSHQGTVIDNFIYGKVLLDIIGAFEHDYFYSVPRLYSDDTDNFDHKPLRNFLSKKEKELVNKNISNYLDLKQFMDQFRIEYSQLY